MGRCVGRGDRCVRVRDEGKGARGRDGWTGPPGLERRPAGWRLEHDGDIGGVLTAIWSLKRARPRRRVEPVSGYPDVSSRSWRPKAGSRAHLTVPDRVHQRRRASARREQVPSTLGEAVLLTGSGGR